ncbi:MAG: MBL fold metallo-hydrolase [Bacteroidetes bacterium]|nr:MBL fold metallo-hydrolase [Bacteroidota bacterium]
MGIKIKTIKNNPVESNCYIISADKDQSCIVIDPGEKECEQLLSYLEENSLTPGFIILTHEHFDHIWGVSKLKSIYDFKLICSRYCSGRITTQKGNLSVFYDQVGFVTNPADITVEEMNYLLPWVGGVVKFIPTPGHTGGCVCVDVDNNLFTGDFMIKGVRTNTKLPGSSIERLNESFETVLSSYRDNDPFVYPGHGEPFYFHEVVSTLKSAIPVK